MFCNRDERVSCVAKDIQKKSSQDYLPPRLPTKEYDPYLFPVLSYRDAVCFFQQV